MFLSWRKIKKPGQMAVQFLFMNGGKFILHIFIKDTYHFNQAGALAAEIPTTHGNIKYASEKEKQWPFNVPLASDYDMNMFNSGIYEFAIIGNSAVWQDNPGWDAGRTLPTQEPSAFSN